MERYLKSMFENLGLDISRYREAENFISKNFSCTEKSVLYLFYYKGSKRSALEVSEDIGMSKSSCAFLEHELTSELMDYLNGKEDENLRG